MNTIGILTPLRMCLLFVCLGLFCSGCSREKTVHNSEELEKYVKGKDWPDVQTLVRNGVKVSVRYMPSEALLLPQYKRYEEMEQTLAKGGTKSKTMRDSLLQDARNKIAQAKAMYDNSLYFSMTIGYEDSTRDIEYDRMKEGFTAYSSWMQKLAFGLKEYVTLETETTGEVPLDIYDMQRTFGITKDRTFLLVFPRKFNEQEVLSSKNKEIILWLKEFGLATGELRFSFDLPLMTVHYTNQ
jgi:hypothetical protein